MKSIVIRRIPDEVFKWIQTQAQANVLSTEAWLRLKLIEMAQEEKKTKTNRAEYADAIHKLGWD